MIWRKPSELSHNPYQQVFVLPGGRRAVFATRQGVVELGELRPPRVFVEPVDAGPLPMQVVALSPDAAFLAVFRSRLRLVTLSSGAARELETCRAFGGTYAPDGATLAVMCARQIDIIDAARGEIRKSIELVASRAALLALRYSADGRRLLGVGRDSMRTHVWSWAAPSYEPAGDFPIEASLPAEAGIAAFGPYLGVGSHHGTTAIYAIESGHVAHTFPDRAISALAASQDGAVVFAGRRYAGPRDEKGTVLRFYPP